LIGFLGVAIGAGYIGWLDFRVRHELEARRWVLPARVYARALRLYPGMSLSPAAMVEELNAAGFRRVRRARRPGSYDRDASEFRIATRRFAFADGVEPARRLGLRFDGRRLSVLTSNGRPIRSARLTPALIGHLYADGREDRVLVKIAQVPKIFIAILLATEDRRFWTHHGVSPLAIARAAWVNLRAGATLQGGSTITQQLAKNLFLSSERTWRRKLNEALIALILDARYAKKDILQAYLNQVFLGQQGRRGIYGFGLAARFYYGRRLAELDLPEMAMLVGLVRGPSYYDPRRHPRRALARRNVVLQILRDRRVVSARVVAAAQARPLAVLANPPTGAGSYPAFLDLVRRQLRRDYRAGDLRSRGLRIFTTLDPYAQAIAERALSSRLGALERHRKGVTGLQGAVIVTARETGEVLAVVGDRAPRRRGFNRALDALRPIGSLVKPAVYLAALEEPGRYRLDTLIEDRPLRLRGVRGESWRPRNYDGRAHGAVPLYLALAHSYNLATVRLGLDVGLSKVIGALRRLGLRRPLNAYPSLLLGAVDLTPIDVATMYQTLAEGGFRTPLRAIRAVSDGQGRTLARYGLVRNREFAAAPAAEIVRAMQAVMEEGTGRSAYRRLPGARGLAGKTGTTDGLRDSWFAGFDQKRLAVVWVGRDDNRPSGLTGASGALRVWTDFMAGVGTRPLRVATPPAAESGLRTASR